ncbi:MAG: sensor histidine kinase [Myxococcaceae bacterium]|nr:sensor histidine kinase [Myxococcaceae bacterium]
MKSGRASQWSDVREPAERADDRPRFVSTGTTIAIIATTAPGLLQAISPASPTMSAVLAVLIIGALGISTFGVAWAERQPGLRQLGGVLAAYGIAVCVAFYLSQGRSFLITMPFASMVVLYLPLRVALSIEVLLVAFASTIVIPQIAADERQLMSGIAGFASSIAFVFVFSLIARRERYARRDVERLNKQVAELATHRERSRIAREIHDSLGHYLTIANVQLEAARATADGRDARLEKVQQLLRDGLAELRSSVSLLREGASDVKPFAQALDGLVAECNATGLAADLVTEGAARPLPVEIGFTLFRAAQEALTNVRRHARAKKVSVQLQYAAARVKLRVRDDGVGGTPKPGNGLKGLEERLAQVGGTLAVAAPQSGGFELTVEVPA